MMEHSLRPIGTEFEIDLGVNLSSTDSNSMGRKIKYRVVGHKKVARFYGDKEGKLAEELEAISISYYDIDYSKCRLNFTY